MARQHRKIFGSSHENRKYPFQRTYVCDLCGRRSIGYGHNPQPLLEQGVACFSCNEDVLRARFRIIFEEMGLNPLPLI